MAFLSGDTSAAILTSVWLLLLVYVVVYIIILNKPMVIKPQKVKREFSTSCVATWAYLVCATIFNCAVLLLMNCIYVYVSFHYDVVSIWTTIIALAIFKVAWNVKIIPLLLRQASVSDSSNSLSRGNIALLQSLWIMFNNVVVRLSLCSHYVIICNDTLLTFYRHH